MPAASTPVAARSWLNAVAIQLRALRPQAPADGSRRRSIHPIARDRRRQAHAAPVRRQLPFVAHVGPQRGASRRSGARACSATATTSCWSCAASSVRTRNRRATFSGVELRLRNHWLSVAVLTTPQPADRAFVQIDASAGVLGLGSPPRVLGAVIRLAHGKGIGARAQVRAGTAHSSRSSARSKAGSSRRSSITPQAWATVVRSRPNRRPASVSDNPQPT